jgi:hypothetical protein
MTFDGNMHNEGGTGRSPKVTRQGVLSEILALFRASNRSLSVEDIAEQIGKPTPFVEVLLGHLQHFGYIEECVARSTCEVCPLWQRCGVSSEGQRFFALNRTAPTKQLAPQ